MCALVTGVHTYSLPILVSIVASFTSASTYLVPPGWSIFVEIVASLTFPIIVAAERKRLLLILLALGVASAFMFAGHLRIGTYWFCFVAGAALFNWLKRYNGTTRGAGTVLLVGIVALIAVRLGFTWAYHDPLFAVIEATLATICVGTLVRAARSEEHTSELQSLMRISYAVFCLKKK